jgi:hypothetical protein
MAESLGDAVLDLRVGSRRYNQDIDNAERKAKGLDSTFKRIGKNLSGFGDKMSTRVSLPLALVGAAAFKLAADAEEAANKFEVVMGGSADAVRERLKALEATVPLTTGEFLSLAAGVQDLLVPMGLARDAGAEMSATFVEIAGDIAAFNDVSPKQVLDDIRSGLVGSSEPLFKYGVDTRVAALQAVALANGLIKEGEALTDVTRAQAVLLQIQAQSTDAMGTAAREAGSAAFETRALARDVRQLGEDIGQVLIPIFTPMISGLRNAVSAFRELTPETQAWVVKLGLVFAAVGPILSITGRLITSLGIVTGLLVTKTAATVADTAALRANAVATGTATGLITTQTAAIAANRTGTGAAAAATSGFSLTMVGKAGLVGAVGAAGFAVGTIIRKFSDWASESDSLTARLLRVNVLTRGFIEMTRTGVYTDALEEAGFYGKSIADLNAELAKTIAAQNALPGVTDRLRSSVEQANAALDQMVAAGKEISFRYIEVEGVLRKFDIATGELIPTMAAAALVVKDLGPAYKNLTLAMASTKAEVKETIPFWRELIGVQTDFMVGPPSQVPELVDTLARSMERYGVVLPDTGREIKEVAALMESGQVPAAQMARIIDDLSDRYKRLGVLTPELAVQLDALAESTDTATGSMEGFFGSLFGGTSILKSFGKQLDSLVEGITGGEGLSGFFSNLGAGLVEGLGQILSQGISSLINLGIGLALKGLKALGRKILGFFTGLFGGPSAAELAGRQVAGDFRDALRAELSADILADVKLQFPNQIETASFLAAIQQRLIAAGVSAQAAAEQARQWGIALFEAEKRGGDAVQAVIDQINAATEAAGIMVTGIDEATQAWRDWSTSVGISFEGPERQNRAFFENLAATMGLSAETAAAFVEGMLANQRDANKAFEKDLRASLRAQAQEAGLTGDQIQEFVRANLRKQRREERKAARDRRKDEDEQLGFFTETQTAMLDAASAAAAGAAQAWSTAASDAVAAWRNANNTIFNQPATGGGNTSGASAGMGSGSGSFTAGDDVFVNSGGGGRRRGGGGANLTLELVLDRSGGEVLARKMIRITPEIEREMGLA